MKTHNSVGFDEAESYVKSIKDKYPQFTEEELVEIIVSPFKFLRDKIEGNTLEEVEIEWFGSFNVRPYRVKVAQKDIKRKLAEGKISPDLFKIQNSMYERYFKRSEEKNCFIPTREHIERDIVRRRKLNLPQRYTQEDWRNAPYRDKERILEKKRRCNTNYFSKPDKRKLYYANRRKYRKRYSILKKSTKLLYKQYTNFFNNESKNKSH